MIPEDIYSTVVDPINVEELLKELEQLENKEEIYNFIQAHLSGWLVYSLEQYSTDYAYLQINWQAIAKKCGVNTQKIVLVKNIIFDQNHTLIAKVCEKMTQKGYVVRREGEFIPCEKCQSAIPAIEVWHLMKEKNLPVPAEWNSKCQRC